jgi:hypothetical protein
LVWFLFLQTQLATVGAALAAFFADAATAERGQAGGQAVTGAALLGRRRSLLLVAHGRLALRRVVLSRGRAVRRLRLLRVVAALGRRRALLVVTLVGHGECGGGVVGLALVVAITFLICEDGFFLS